MRCVCREPTHDACSPSLLLAADGAASIRAFAVRIRVDPEGDANSALHISRHAGDVLQFHSFYRDVRNQLAGANGWVNNHGKYEHVVTSPVPAPSPQHAASPKPSPLAASRTARAPAQQ